MCFRYFSYIYPSLLSPYGGPYTLPPRTCIYIGVCQDVYEYAKTYTSMPRRIRVCQDVSLYIYYTIFYII